MAACFRSLGRTFSDASRFFHGVLRVQAKGADVNGKVFRGYPATAAAREGRVEVAEQLVRAGASQPACEEAVVEAALQGQAALAAIFMGSDLVRPRVAVHALVSAAARGFVDVVDTLIKVQCLPVVAYSVSPYQQCVYASWSPSETVQGVKDAVLLWSVRMFWPKN